MALKFALFLLCATALISSQVESTSPQSAGQAGIIDNIKAIVKIIENLLDRILPAVQNIVDTIKTDYLGFQSTITGAISVVADAIFGVFIRILNDLAVTSTPATKKVTACVNNAHSNITSVFVNLGKDLTTCAKDDLTNVISQLGPLVSDLLKLHNDAKEVLKGLDKCQGDDVTGFVCVLEVFGTLIDTAVKELPHLVFDLTPIFQNANPLVQTFLNCWYNGIKATFLISGGKVFDQIATCSGA